MIILNNRAVLGTDTVVYDIHRDVEENVSLGTIAWTTGESGAVVGIRLYDDELINGSNWPLGTHHYIDEIMECLRFAEPNMQRAIAMDCNKVVR